MNDQQNTQPQMPQGHPQQGYPQPYQGGYPQQGYPNGAWQQQPPKKKNWFLRHKFLTAILAAVILGVIISVSSGGDSSKTDGSSGPSAAAGDTKSPGSSGSKDEGKSDAKKLPAVGTPVRDGKFEFTITKVERGKKQVGAQYAEEKAQGEFTLVHVSVKNVGDQQQALSDSDQKAMDAKGTQFSTDSTAGISIEGNEVLFNEINPGNQVKGVLVFDAPVGTKLTKIELHDSMFSDGVEASLE